MNNKLHKLLAAAFAATLAVGIFALAGCSSSNTNSDKASASGTQTITDMAGRTVEVPAEAERVIGIGASSLRMICYMQAADKVVGVEQSEQQDSVTCAYRPVSYTHLDVYKRQLRNSSGAKGRWRSGCADLHPCG